MIQPAVGRLCNAVAALVRAAALVRGTGLEGYGSMTLGARQPHLDPRSLRAASVVTLCALLWAVSCVRQSPPRAPGSEAGDRPRMAAPGAIAPADDLAPGRDPAKAPGAALPGTSPPREWARRFGGPEGDEAAAVAVDRDGNVYVVGQITGTVAMDGVILEGAGHSDILVAKLSAAGAVLWARLLGGEAHDFGTGIAVSSDGRAVIILGAFSGTLQAGRETIHAQGPQDTLLAALSSDGALSWARPLSSPAWDIGLALALDGNDDIVVAGAFSGSLHIGDESLKSAGEADAFVARFDIEGELLWARRAGGPGWDEAAGVAVDREGRALVAGTGDDGALLAAYTRDGRESWTRRLGARGTMALAVAVDPEGRFLVTGSFEGTVSLGGPALSSAGKQDLFVARFERDGAYLWARRFGGVDSDAARAVLVVPGGDFVIAGSFSGDVDGGSESLHGGPRDLFFARYSPGGDLLWSVGVSAPGAGTRSIAATSDGGVVAAGSFLGRIRLGESSLESAGGFDAFVVVSRVGLARESQ